MKRMFSSSKGFTLIELLVVIAIIGLLASTVFASLGSARGKARDARRLSDLKAVQTALELYYASNGAYPSTAGGWWGNSPGCYGGYASTGASASIPNLAPTYIPSIPQEQTPVGGACYLYRSDDGTAYKFLAHQTMEGCTAGSCPLQDIPRSSQRSSSVCVGTGCDY